MKEKLIITRNFLYRLFIIGIVLNIFAQFMFMMAIKGQALNEVAVALNLSSSYLVQMIISSIISIRIVLLYFILCPAFALHWTIARDKNLN